MGIEEEWIKLAKDLVQ